jgi:hypothetical protein
MHRQVFIQPKGDIFARYFVPHRADNVIWDGRPLNFCTYPFKTESFGRFHKTRLCIRSIVMCWHNRRMELLEAANRWLFQDNFRLYEFIQIIVMLSGCHIGFFAAIRSDFSKSGTRIHRPPDVRWSRSICELFQEKRNVPDHYEISDPHRISGY